MNAAAPAQQAAPTSNGAPLTIVHVLFSSRVAGAERQCLDLAQAQAQAGHTVHIVGAAGSAMQAELPPGVQYHPMALPLFRGWRLRPLLRRLGAQVCHAHLGPACKAAAVAKQGLGADCAFVATLHVGFKAHHHQDMDGLVCVNRGQAEALSALGYTGRSCVVQNWAPTPRAGLAASEAAPSLRQELGLTESAVVVGAVGRLHPSKGMDALIRAFRTALEAPGSPEAALVIVGDGPQRPALQALRGADMNIFLLGYRHDVDRLMAGMDMFVSASLEEASPLTILEAMRAGLPIVATATDGSRDVLQGTEASLVPLGQAPALVAALRERLAQAARSRPEAPRVRYDLSPFEREPQVAKVLKFYGELRGA
jgi:glycosyltransferase involved in cell wall biosynthesis